MIVAGLLLTIGACGPSMQPTPGPSMSTEAPNVPIFITPTHWQASILADVAALRAEPRSDAQLVGTLARGAVVDVIGTTPGRDWYFILAPGASGGSQQAWIAASLATQLSGQASPTTAVAHTPTAARSPTPAPATATNPPGYAALKREVADASWGPVPDPNDPSSQFTLPAGTWYRYQGEREGERCRIALLPPADNPSNIAQPWVACQSIAEAPSTEQPTTVDVASSPPPPPTVADTVTSAPPPTPIDTIPPVPSAPASPINGKTVAPANTALPPPTPVDTLVVVPSVQAPPSSGQTMAPASTALPPVQPADTSPPVPSVQALPSTGMPVPVLPIPNPIVVITVPPVVPTAQP